MNSIVEKKAGIRSCIVCRKRLEKDSLLRIVPNDENKATFDKTQKMNKRAVYICNDKKCIESCINMIEKNKMKLKIGIDLDSFLDLLKEIEF